MIRSEATVWEGDRRSGFLIQEAVEMEPCSRLFSRSRVVLWEGSAGLKGPSQGTNLIMRLYWRGLRVAEAPREGLMMSFGVVMQ